MTLKPDPLGLPRNPLAVYLLCVAFVSGLSSALGFGTSRSIDDLPHSVSLTWGTVLALGSAAALTGMFWQGDPRTGLVVKRFGYIALTFASLIYATVLVATFLPGAFMVAFFVYGFAAACAYRALVVNRAIRLIIEESL